MAIVGGLLLVISPFQAANHNQYGHYSLSTISGLMLVESVVTAKSSVDQTSRDQAFDSLVDKDWYEASNPFEKSAIAKRSSFEWVKSRPGEFFVLHGLGMISFLIGTEKSAYLYVIARQERPQLVLEGRVEPFADRVARNIYDIKKEYFLTPVLGIKLLIEYVFLVGGLFVLIRRKQKLAAIFFVLSIAYFIIGTAQAGRAPRYRIPVLPIYAIIGGGGIVFLSFYFRSWLDRLRLLYFDKKISIGWDK